MIDPKASGQSRLTGGWVIEIVPSLVRPGLPVSRSWLQRTEDQVKGDQWDGQIKLESLLVGGPDFAPIDADG